MAYAGVHQGISGALNPPVADFQPNFDLVRVIRNGFDGGSGNSGP